MMGQERKSRLSLDHIIGAREQRDGDFEAEGPRGLEIDHQLELGRLFDRDRRL